MRTVGIGIQDFEKVRSNNQFYVDKTAFIAKWYRSNDDITLITRPRRFGKTLTMDMLHCFFSMTHAGRSDLFSGLAIEEDAEMMCLQGTFPTISLSLAGVKGDTFEAFLLSLAGRLGEALRGHRNLLEGDLLDPEEKSLFLEMSRLTPRIPDSRAEKKKYREYLYDLTHLMKTLSGWLFSCYQKKPLLFLDEYDTPLQHAWLHHYYDEAVSIMRELFSESFKENKWLGRGVITGITRIAKESLFSDMNNLAICSVISGGYDAVFGFTREEMAEILDEYGLSEKGDLVRFWYDGFTVGQETGIYNPWSVLNFLARRERPPQDYWAQSGGLGLVDHLMRGGGIALKEGLEALLRGEVIERTIQEDLVFPRLEYDENSVWSLLVAAGYLKPLLAGGNPSGKDPSKDESFDGYLQMASSGSLFPSGMETRLALTNYESRICLHKMVKGWFDTRSGNYMENFASALLRDDLQEMNDQLQHVLTECASGFDSGVKPAKKGPQPENFFHGLTLGMLTCLSGQFRVTSNRESGFGRYDVSLEPSDPQRSPFAFLLEFKVFDEKEGDSSIEDTAHRARRQIEDRRYDADLTAKGFAPGRIRKYGVGFRGKEVKIVV